MQTTIRTVFRVRVAEPSGSCTHILLVGAQFGVDACRAACAQYSHEYDPEVPGFVVEGPVDSFVFKVTAEQVPFFETECNPEQQRADLKLMQWALDNLVLLSVDDELNDSADKCIEALKLRLAPQ